MLLTGGQCKVNPNFKWRMVISRQAKVSSSNVILDVE